MKARRGKRKDLRHPHTSRKFTEFINTSNPGDPLVVYAGDTLSIKAAGFKPYETITMHLDKTDASNAAVLTRWADAAGALEISWRYVENTAAGAHSITLKGATSGAKVTQNFTTLAPATLPDAPATVVAENTGVLSVKISGYQVTGAASYSIYRQATKTLESGEDEANALLVSGVRTNTYTDLTVNNGKSYTYFVKSADSYGTKDRKSRRCNSTHSG